MAAILMVIFGGSLCVRGMCICVCTGQKVCGLVMVVLGARWRNGGQEKLGAAAILCLDREGKQRSEKVLIPARTGERYLLILEGR